MTTFAFIDSACTCSGLVFRGDAEHARDTCPAGFRAVAVPADYNPAEFAVVVTADDFGGEVVSVVRRPPAKPPDEPGHAWEWDGTGWRLQPTRATLEQWAAEELDRRMAAIVTRQLKAIRTGEGLDAVNAYIECCLGYRTLPGYPHAIQWPQEPA